ncbi:MAG TPA: hypothetical protein VFV87_16075, partial [Pirellulaceae bacterium]|nr:hypothetical protein [Pirellulaceae bacterium]
MSDDADSPASDLTMDEILLALLIRLEAIGDEHEELFDSEVRERMGNAVFHGFVKPMYDFQL